METIDLTPTPEEMRQLLRFIIEKTDDDESREWARSELDRIQDVVAWAERVPVPRSELPPLPDAP